MAYIRSFTEDDNKIPVLSRWRYVTPNVHCNRTVGDNRVYPQIGRSQHRMVWNTVHVFVPVSTK